ncbi:DNA-binding protein, partial [Xylella fastidiosa subsp. multiplex]|nr:DNA-binding protein [Xylella fastidiosa subsp. multiplex]
MAKIAKNLKAAPTNAVQKQTATPATITPLQETLSNSALVAHLAESCALAAKDVRTSLGAL